jgi:hypothetical protein
MSGLRKSSSTRQGNSFFINIGTVVNGTNTFTETGAAVFIPSLNVGAGAAAGTLVLRDMGKTVRVPGTSNGNNTVQRILRKVQRFDGPAATTASWPVTNGFVGFNDGVGGATADAVAGFETFYIEISEAPANQPLFVRLGF